MLVLDHERLAELCRQFGVDRLVVFGSAVTDRFDVDRSDVDFLVEFSDDVSSVAECLAPRLLSR